MRGSASKVGNPPMKDHPASRSPTHRVRMAGGRLRSIDRRASRNPWRDSRASGKPATFIRSSGSASRAIQLLAPVARADVVHPPGDHRLHRPLGGRLAALVREQVGLLRLHEQRLELGGDSSSPGAQNRASDRPGNAAPPSSPSRSRTVAGTSRRLTGSATTRPAGTPFGSTITSGTSTSCRYRLHPWKKSPWSPRCSPWSEVTTTSVSSSTPRLRSSSSRAPSRRSRWAIESS